MTIGAGITGYMRARSYISLSIGSVIGACYGVSAQRISSDQPNGVELAILASTLLTAGAVPRVVKTKGKRGPLGLLGLGLAGTALFFSARGR